jgi:hypothetical protein
MTIPLLKTAFNAGELSPSLYGRLDLQKWNQGCSVARNMVVSYKGGLFSRAGTALAGMCKQPASAASVPPRIIPFKFNIYQSYILEFGDSYMRVVADGAYVTEAAFAVTGLTSANPARMTVPGNNFANGDWIYLSGLSGPSSLNTETFVVANLAGASFTLADTFGEPVDTLMLPAWTAGGTVARIYTLPTPYAAADLPYLKYDQSADVMSLCLVNQQAETDYATLELTRMAANRWVLASPQFGSSIGPPSSCTVTGTAYSSGPGPAAYGYVVTAIDAATGDESIASSIGVVTGVVDISGQFGTNTVSWSPVSGAASYNIYRATPDFTNVGEFAGQLFGYAGSSNSNFWQDDNVIPDDTTVPPLHTDPFAPGAVLDVPISLGGGSYTTATTVTINSATGSGFVGIPIIGGARTGQTLVFQAGAFADGDTLTQTIGTATAAGSVIGVSGTTVHVQLAGSTQFSTATGAGEQPIVTNQHGTQFILQSVSPYTISGSDAIVGVYIKAAGQNYLSTDSVVFTDSGGGSGAAASLTIGPATGTNPGAVAYFQQRRFYGYTLNEPDTYNLTQPGSYTDFDAGIPPIDSDAIVGTPWAQQVNGIQWAINMPGGLVVATGEDCWLLSGTGGAGSAITPSQQSAQQQESNGFSPTLPPIKINYQLLFGQSLGSIICSLNYNFYANIYTGEDITVLSSHLFANYQVVQWAWAREPYKVVWCVRDDGRMLALTYVKSEEVQGWTRHDTNGLAVSVAVASEPPVNAVYWVIKRYIVGKGQWAYFVERMDNRLWTDVEDCWCVDAALALPMPEPNATLTAAAAAPTYGALAGPVIEGGANYTAPSGTVVDLGGMGSGAVVSSVTVAGGVITGFTIAPEGWGYVTPVIVFEDATGDGASGEVLIDTALTFNASAPVFSGSVGSIIRMGGGRGTVTAVISPTQAVAAMAAPIAATVPNDPNMMPVPAPPGAWTLTAPVTAVTGLDDLEGMAVTGLADGNVIQMQPVVGGTIMLPQPASAIIVGLPFLPQAQSMHADLPGQMIQGKRKRIQGVTTRFANTRGALLGQDQPIAAVQPNQAELPWNVSPNLMTELLPYGNDVAAGLAAPLFTGDHYSSIAGDYTTTDGQPSPAMVAVMQPNPLPLEILAFIPELDVGDLPNA